VTGLGGLEPKAHSDFSAKQFNYPADPAVKIEYYHREGDNRTYAQRQADGPQWPPRPSTPLASLPPIAGGKLSWTLAAHYNSKAWDMYRTQEESTVTTPATRFITSHLQSAGNPWSIGARYSIQVTESHSDVDWLPPLPGDPDFQLMQQQQFQTWYKVTLYTPDGTTHELRPVDGTGTYPGTTRDYLMQYSWKTPASLPTPAAMNFYSYDGSYLWAVIQPFTGLSPQNWDVYMPDGTRISNSSSGDQFIIDTNGNSVRIYGTTTVTSSGTVTTTHFVDQQTLREIRYVDDQTVNVPLGQGRVEYQTVTGAWEQVLINFSQTTVNGWAYQVGDSTCIPKAELIFNPGITVIDTILLPPTEPNVTRKFSFHYNSDDPVTANYNWQPDCSPSPKPLVTTMSRGLGSLSRITLPSNAVARYSYLEDQAPDPLDAPQAQTSALTGPVDPADIVRDGVVTKKLDHDSITDVWTYSGPSPLGTSSMSGPDGQVVVENSYPHDPALQYTLGGLDGRGGLAYRTKRSNKVITERKWRLNSINGISAGSTGANGTAPFNPVVDIEFTTLDDTPGTHVQMSAKQFQYDLNGNVTGETDYDWFAPSLADPYRDAQGVPTQVPPGVPVLRLINNTYYNDSTSQTSPNIYHKRINGSPPQPLILDALQLTTTGPSQTEFHYDGVDNTPPTKGNLTKQRR